MRKRKNRTQAELIRGIGIRLMIMLALIVLGVLGWSQSQQADIELKREIERLQLEADMLLVTPNSPEALARIDAASTLAPDDPENDILRAEALMYLREYEAAIAALDRAIPHVPDQRKEILLSLRAELVSLLGE